MTSEIEPDVDMINDQAFDKILHEVLEQDSKGLLEDDIEEICYLYELHADDNREAILEFIAESIYYNQNQ
jgi:hypothetical protein